MEASLFRYIWNETRREQIWILFIILVSMPFSFLMLDLPKYIVNGPIQARGFEHPGATQHYFQIRIPVPSASVKADGFFEVLHGFDLDRIWSLVMLSAAFLVLVIINGLFKYYINFYKGRLGERMLGQFRYELMDRVLRFPMSEFRRVKGAEVATMIRDEVEPLGGFIGDAIVQPVFLLGQIATAIVFILVQNPYLGLIAVTLLIVQGMVIPRLRRRQLDPRPPETAPVARPRRRGRRDRRRHRRRPHQRRLGLPARRPGEPARQDLQHPLRALPAQVLRQVPEQPAWRRSRPSCSTWWADSSPSWAR